MGSDASVDGRIEIDPPIPWRQFAASAYHRVGAGLRSSHYAYSLELEVRTTREETERGVAEYRDAVAIVPVGDETNARDVPHILGEINEQFGEGRTFTGRIDVWYRDYELSSARFKIDPGCTRHPVCEYRPTTIWPAGSE